MSDEEIHARLRKFLIASLVENAGLVGLQIFLILHWIPGNTMWFTSMVEGAT